MKTEPVFTLPPTLLDMWLHRLRLTWARATLWTAVVLVLGLAFALWAEGISLAEFYASGSWRILLLAPAEVLYFMLISQIQARTRLEEVKAIRPLVRLDDAEFQAMLATDPSLNLRNEWLAVALGFALGVAMRLVGLDPSDPWLNAYAVLTAGMMWALISLAVYIGLASPPTVSLAEKRGLRLDLFDLSFIQPVARQSLVTVFSFIGGITIPLFLVPLQALLHPVNLFLYFAIVAMAVWVFFQSMKGTHHVLAAAKRREIGYVRRRLAATYQQLQACAEDSEGAHALTADLRAWLALEQRLLSVPEWPVDLRTLRNLAISILVPIISVLARLVAERLFSF